MNNNNKSKDADGFAIVNARYGFDPVASKPFNKLVANFQAMHKVFPPGYPDDPAVDIFNLDKAYPLSHPDLFFFWMDDVKKELDKRTKDGNVTYQDIVDIKVDVVAKLAGLKPWEVDQQSRGETQIAWIRAGGTTKPPYTINATSWFEFMKGNVPVTGYAIGTDSPHTVGPATLFNDTKFWPNISKAGASLTDVHKSFPDPFANLTKLYFRGESIVQKTSISKFVTTLSIVGGVSCLAVVTFMFAARLVRSRNSVDGDVLLAAEGSGNE